MNRFSYSLPPLQFACLLGFLRSIVLLVVVVSQQPAWASEVAEQSAAIKQDLTKASSKVAVNFFNKEAKGMISLPAGTFWMGCSEPSFRTRNRCMKCS